jgi:hypothetical protein
LLRFFTPTHTHDFDNYNDGYGRSKTTLVQSFSGLSEIRLLNGFKFGEDYDFFKIAILFIGLGSLIICTHDLTIITKIKKIIHYCESFGYGGKSALTNVSNNLSHVSILAEDGSQ